MKANNNIQKKLGRSWLSSAFLIILGVIFFCGFSLANSNYGKYQRSQEVAQLFEKGDFNPHYTYYYAHTASNPEALIGIEPSYKLDNDLWTKVDPSQIKHLMDNIWIRSGFSPFTFGSYMLSPDGKTIGIYYSKWAGGPIVMGRNNTVNVNLPNDKDTDSDDRGFFPRPS